ncbi:hypothetical protein I350_00337 [Cryptococcus amylolentus CBS 6273]|uniref:Uncharacterized protein n=1 Tax=Cryptococcus amylolentus CBS 6273 TaxID=1296118 RepID=A0A1E3KF10_9TREE|nr:hypothetical protein I350_00337 [Cryptococcus amylolentus CBS 6273]
MTGHTIVVGTSLSKLTPQGTVGDGFDVHVAIGITKSGAQPSDEAKPQHAVSELTARTVCHTVLMAISLVSACYELTIANMDEKTKAGTDLAQRERQWQMLVYEMAWKTCTKDGGTKMGHHVKFSKLTTCRAFDKAVGLQSAHPKAFLSFLRLRCKVRPNPPLSAKVLTDMHAWGINSAKRIRQWVAEEPEKRDVVEYLEQVNDPYVTFFLARGAMKQALKSQKD